MSVRQSAGRPRFALGNVFWTLFCFSLLAIAPVRTAHAQTACAAAWNASTVYTAGNTASESGINYVANWWTQGNNPATNNGGAGSGQPWTSQGACSGSSSSSSSSSSGGSSSSSSSSSGGSSSSGSGSVSGLLFSPYKDITINLNWNTNVMQTAVTGTDIPIVGSGSLFALEPNLGAITLAFATGECGSESWGGVTPSEFASANIQALNSAGLDYVVSTGGEAGVFTCSTQAGMATFLSTYVTAHMVGLDYDIEGGQTQADITNLVAQSVYAQSLYPNLRISFTLQTLGASDGSYGGLNSLGAEVMQAIQASSLKNYTINLMTMDYGGTSASVCVVVNGSCEMGQSAIQAVENLEHSYGVPASQIEVTPMIGVNDTSSEITTIADVDTITSYAVSNKLAGLHFWSLDRDTPCSDGTASPTCNSVPTSTALQYTNEFLSDLGR